MNTRNKGYGLHFFGRCLRWVAVSCAILASDVCANAADPFGFREAQGQNSAVSHTSIGHSPHSSSVSGNIHVGSKSGAGHSNSPARSATADTKAALATNAVVTSPPGVAQGGVSDGVVTITGSGGRSVVDAASFSANSIYPTGLARSTSAGNGFGHSHPGGSSVGVGGDSTSGEGDVDVTDPGLPGNFAGGADAGLAGNASLDMGGGANLTSGPMGGAGSLAGFAFAGRGAAVSTPVPMNGQLTLDRNNVSNDAMDQTSSVQIVPKGPAESPMMALLMALGWISLVVGIGLVQRGSGST